MTSKYIQNRLTKDEYVVYEPKRKSKLIWWIILLLLTWTLIGALISIPMAALLTKHYKTYLALTNKRIMLQDQDLHEYSIPLESIENIVFENGALSIISSAYDNTFRINFIADQHIFKQKFDALMNS
ncbi:hypothetical protein [Lonepinella sp. BR2357]|uniref:hypothetical protein n=1 Tax=Lonepinella sp. BR2357 TaxID=3434549 RepID=UPI003F6E3D30